MAFPLVPCVRHDDDDRLHPHHHHHHHRHRYGRPADRIIIIMSGQVTTVWISSLCMGPEQLDRSVCCTAKSIARTHYTVHR
eukprot:1036869-Rhodomonas_salina.1